MPLTKLLTISALLILIDACATTSAGPDSFCALAERQDVADEDKLTPETENEIWKHDCIGVLRCGWEGSKADCLKP
jgi:hypothetical protein